MQKQEIEKKVESIHSKLGEDAHLYSLFINNVIAYFRKEYLVEDYDINNLEEDVCNLANSYLSMEKYKSFNDKLNDDELSFIAALMTNYLECLINEKI
jgi:hypothetical protein